MPIAGILLLNIQCSMVSLFVFSFNKHSGTPPVGKTGDVAVSKTEAVVWPCRADSPRGFTQRKHTNTEETLLCPEMCTEWNRKTAWTEEEVVSDRGQRGHRSRTEHC